MVNSSKTGNKTYVGLDADLSHGMTPTAKIILDAKVFGLIGDDETCAGWTAGRIQALYDKVSEAWHPYGFLPSRLPEDLRARHAQFYDAAVKTARERGWDPDAEVYTEERDEAE